MAHDELPAERHGSPHAAPSEPRRVRFTLGTAMLVLAILCVMAAAAGYLVRGIRGSRNDLFTFLLFTLLAPLAVVLVLRAVHRLARRFSGPGPGTD